jgi:hypothetical protein
MGKRRRTQQDCRRCFGGNVDEYARKHVALWRDGYCDACHATAAAYQRATETMQGLAAWAEYEGTRQRIATRLAGELRQRCGKNGQRDRERWCFLWEQTGDQKSLRKIVTKLQPVWEAEGISVTTPPVAQTPVHAVQP